MEVKQFTAGIQGGSRSNRAGSMGHGGASSLADDMSRIGAQIAANRDDDDYQAAQISFAKGLDALDVQFEKDEDLETLSDRRAEKVRQLADSIYEGKSQRVQEKLKDQFAMVMERDGIKTKAAVHKRDGQRRVAQFHDDTDQYINQMIMAPDDQSYDNASAMWNARLESIQPYMDPVSFTKLRDGYRDQVKFQRAWNGTTGEGEFDPSQFMDLSPEQLGRLEARHHAVARENQRLAMEHMQDRANILLPKLQDSLASAMTTGVPMDGTEDMLAELKTLGEAGAAKEAELRAQFNGANRVWDTLDAVKYRPFSEQMAAAETLRPEPGGDNFIADMELYQAATKKVVQEAKRFEADPAGYVRGEAERRARAAADPWVKDEDLEPYVLRASMNLQREYGVRQPRVMSTVQAEGLRDGFERADGQGKADILSGLTGQYGEYDLNALEEMGLETDHLFAAETYLSDPFLGRRLLDITSIKESDISVAPAAAKDIRKDVDAEYFSGMGALFNGWYQLTGNRGHLEMSSKLHSLTTKAGLAGGDGGDAVRKIWGRFDYVVDDDVMIYTPQDTDAENVAERLRSYRRQLPDEYAAFRDGIWKNSSDNTGYVLLLPVGGTAMADEQGNVIVVRDEDLHSAQVDAAMNGNGYYGE